MYKDVWKKFGAKVFIVLCSILLVGGVAIAVPVLRAVAPVPGNGNISLNDVYSATWTGGPSAPLDVVSKAALQVTGADNIVYSTSNGVPVTPLPSLAIQFNGGADGEADMWKLTDKTAYALVATGFSEANSEAELKKAGEHEVGIRAKNGVYFKQDGKMCYFKYEVQRAELNENQIGCRVQLGGAGNDDNYANSGNVKVTVDGHDIDSKDYTITKSPKGYNKDDADKGITDANERVELIAGQSDIYINLRNYTVGADKHDYVSKKIQLTKDITTLNISASYDSSSKTVNIKIKDLSYDLVQGTDYVVSEPVYDEAKKEATVTITASAPYTGSCTKTVSVTEAPETLVDLEFDRSQLVGRDNIAGTLDYDKDMESVTYEVEKEKIGNVWIINGNTFTPDQYEIVGCDIVASASDTAQPLKGRTAGIVRMKLKLSTNEIGYIYYNMRRDINKANISLSSTPEGSLTYTGRPNVKNPVIVFKDNNEESEPLTITDKDKDFEVHYWLEKEGTREPIYKNPDQDNIDDRSKAKTYAGRVYMNIIAKPDANSKGGYYNTLDAESRGFYYDVEPISVDEAKKTGELNLRNASGQYGQMTTQENLLKDVEIYHIQDGGQKSRVNNPQDGTTFTWSYINTKTGSSVPSTWTSLPAGNYKIICNISGNYSGTVSKEFEITQYSGIVSSVEAKCSEDDTSTHEYNGQEHRPKVQLEVPGTNGGASTILQEGEDGHYTVTYVNNKEVSRDNSGAVIEGAEAWVFFTGNDTGKFDISIPFKIQPRTILTETGSNKAKNLSFVEEKNFASDGSVFKFKYSGDSARPVLNNLKYTIDYNGKPKELTLTKGKDYTVDGENEGSKIIKLYNESGGEVTAVNTTDEYYFKIWPQGNFAANMKRPVSEQYVLAGPFKFSQRDLMTNSKEIEYDIDPLPFDQWNDTLSNIEQWIKDNITVTDIGVNPNRDLLDSEFTISIDDPTGDLRNTDGTIKFKINGQGNYINSKTGVLNVGRNIAETEVKEPKKKGSGSNWISFNGNWLLLKEEYERDADVQSADPYALAFGESAGTNLYANSRKEMLNVHTQSASGQYIIGEYEDVDYENGIDYASVTLQGVNGYYGEVTIRIPIVKKLFTDTNYRIEFLEEPVYDGTPQTPKFKLWDISQGEASKVEVTGGFEAIWDEDRNIDANEKWDEKDKELYWGKLTVKGIGGNTGEITDYFKILRRPITSTKGQNALDELMFSFVEGQAVSSLPAMSYIPYTKYLQYVDSKEQITETGTRQTVRLYFFPDRKPSNYTTLTSNDYDYWCTNTKPDVGLIEPDGSDNNPRSNPEAGDPWVVIRGKGNYKGIVITNYHVSQVAFDESLFMVQFSSGRWNQFTGNVIRPEVKVFQKENANDNEWKYEVPATNYEVSYGDDTFVSRDYNNAAGNPTYVIIKSKDNGNYTQQLKKNYVIYGELTDNKLDPFGTKQNARLSYVKDANNRLRLQYFSDKSVLYADLGLTLQQRREGKDYGAQPTPDPSNPGSNIKNSDEYVMTIAGNPPSDSGDYTVDAGSSSVVGPGEITIKGISNRLDKGVIAGEANVPVLIWASLFSVTDDSEGLWDTYNHGSNNITVTGSAITATALKDALSKSLYIYCGGRELEYGEDKDYVFDESSFTNLNIGTNKTVKIIPSKHAGPEKDGGLNYLTDSATIHYNLTSSIGDVVLDPDIIKGEYIYNHGSPLVKSDADLKLVMNNKELINGTDYSVTIKNLDTNEVVKNAIDCGNYTLIIEGKGSYGGRLPQIEFKIIPYSLTDNKDKVTVVLEKERVDFNANRPALPTVTSVSINAGNTSVELNDENFNGGHNYHIEPGSKGSNVNWTDVASDDEQPVVEIHGDGNYTGFVEKPYFILQKDITDDDIIIEEIKDQIYNNNIPITPVPQISWVNKEGEQPAILLNLNPTLHDASVDYNHWKNYDIHFAYKYLDDTKDSGKKTIHIYGIGNFKGETEITYTVKPLNLKDTKLTFLSDEVPVYDGTKQKPAFKLSYGNIDNILTVRDGRPVSTEYLKASNVTVEYVDNVDATTEEKKARVTVKLVEGSTANYEGEITREFTILPAPLESHVRFMYRPKGSGGDVDLRSYKLSYPFKGVDKPVYPIYAQADAELAEDEIGMYYDYPSKANHGKFLVPSADYGSQEDPDGINIEYKYVEPDTDDTDIREEYQRPTPDYAGKVRVTITGKGNYSGKASFWYFIGDDISSDAKISISPTTAVFNSQNQYPTVTISGVDKNKCTIGNYRGEVLVENLITDKDFIDAGTYFIRVEGDPSKGTYATKPETLTFTITPRAFSNSLVIDGFKKEYAYTGYEIRPVGISVTDYIDNIKYRLTEEEDYVLTYSNNLNAGIAYINVKGQGNFSGSASTNFLITSSTISSGGIFGSNSFLDEGSGEISGAVPVAPNNVKLTMDTSDAMYYTGKAVYPKVSISGMTENVDYTVTFSNNVEVGMGVATINGIGNNNGVITKNFRIIAPLSKCTISPIPAQQYTGSAVTPSLTVRCGNTVLMEGTDYTVTYSNNINIGTATATIRALNNANFTGSASVKFSIGNDVGGFIISGFAPSYAYTGNAITPGVVVETGSSTLTLGTDYTVSYSNNVNAGTATITVTGTGKYSGTQTANFIIEAKSIQSCDTTEVTDRTYTGDAYTPDITVSDGGKVLTKGVDYTVTYTNNTNPGTASILIQGMSNNYTGTKVISFKISAVAVKGLKSSSVKYNSLKLTWTKQGYADGYQICNSSSKVVKTVKKNSASITGLSAGKTYKYKVRSYVRNADGTKSYGAFSSVLSVTTKLRTPTVKVVSNAKGQARISWSKVSGASGYEIYYKKSSKAKYKKLKTVNNPNVRVCTVRGMKSGDRAYFRIRAFRKNGSKKVYSALNPLKVITVK